MNWIFLLQGRLELFGGSAHTVRRGGGGWRDDVSDPAPTRASVHQRTCEIRPIFPVCVYMVAQLEQTVLRAGQRGVVCAYVLHFKGVVITPPHTPHRPRLTETFQPRLLIPPRRWGVATTLPEMMIG